MFELRNYQIEISNKGCDILNVNKMLLLNLAVRTGKTLISLNICNLLNFKKVLFITRKKAIYSIQEDYDKLQPNFEIEIVNYESVHKVISEFDIAICDEFHNLGAFPKPSKRVKDLKIILKNKPIIYLSGTPSPESFSQLYHPLHVSSYSPFAQYSNFYKWAKEFVNVKKKNCGFAIVNDYSDANIDKIKTYIDKLTISYTQKEAGFESVVNEQIFEVQLKESTYKLIDRLKKDKVIQGNSEVILADTAVKLMQKCHQLYSGTVKFESGESMVLDTSKAEFIKEKYKGIKIGIFYKYKAEYDALKQVLGDNLTNSISEFNETDKSIALQIVSGREGISLKNAKFLVYYNIDFSATSYFQSRDRMLTQDRLTNTIHWIFSQSGIEYKIYKAVIKKKSYTLRHFRTDLKN